MRGSDQRSLPGILALELKLVDIAYFLAFWFLLFSCCFLATAKKQQPSIKKLRVAVCGRMSTSAGCDQRSLPKVKNKANWH